MKKIPYRHIHGLLLLDKALGVSSNRAMQQVRHLFAAQKAGHTGSLDPLATGMLPICFGEATKFSQYLLDADKQYEAIIKLGESTTTGDAEGEVIASSEIPALTDSQLSQVAQSFLGQQQQVPPMYSALKHEGRPLYELARKGKTVEREARAIEIYQLQLELLNPTEIKMKVSCSKGTYVRTLAEDIGRKLNCEAHLISLRRTKVANFSMKKMLSYEALIQFDEASREQHLIPVDHMLLHFPELALAAAEAAALLQGKVLTYQSAVLGLFRLYDEKQRFIGLGEIQADQLLRAKRLLNLSII